jgi:hypothetical protein
MGCRSANERHQFRSAFSPDQRTPGDGRKFGSHADDDRALLKGSAENGVQEGNRHILAQLWYHSAARRTPCP